MFVGMLLLLMGVLLLLNQMGILEGSVWRYFWPASIIAIGLSMIFNHTKHKKSQ